MIKPIETIYKGYRFRSRLEARWAVFFDALGLEWEYEKEGFNVDGKWYLPDFYLPHLNLWIEIKPGEVGHWMDWDWPKNPVFDNCYDNDGFVMKPPEINLIIIKGKPWIDESFDDPAYTGYIPGDYNYFWCICENCEKIGIEFEGRSARICGDKCYPYDDKLRNSNHPKILKAYLKAKQARFEHGDKIT